MNADWHPDPLGRAQLRYFDGTTWTHHVATNGVQTMEPTEYPLSVPVAGAPQPGFYPGYYGGPAPTPQRGGGRLIAAGILAIISGAVTLLGAIGLLIIASDPNALDCGGDAACSQVITDFSDFFYVMAAIAIVLSVLFIVGGIGACMRKHWGQIAVVVIGSAGALLQIVGIAHSGSAGGLVPLLWFGLIAGLAWSNKRADYEA